MPEKIWIRSLSPSRTFVCTRTPSPTLNGGMSFFTWLAVTSLMIGFMAMASLVFDLKLFKNVRPDGPGLFQGTGGSPSFYLGMVAGKEDFRHGHAPKFGGTRVLRKVEQLAGERFVRQRLFLAEDARDEPAERVDDDGGGKGAVREHVVADAELHVDHAVADPLVNALIMAGEQDQVALLREACGYRGRQW